MRNTTYRFEAGVAPRFDWLRAEVGEVLESQEKVQEQADDALRPEIVRYDAGTSTQLDVLNAQSYLAEAHIMQIQALHDFIVALVRLQRALVRDVPQPLAI
jgi:outer membrane protein TolC